MKSPARRLAWSSLALLGLTGCPSSEPPAPAPAPPPAEKPADKPATPENKSADAAMPTDPSKPSDPGKPENNPVAKAEPAKLTGDEIAEIKKLPADEQTLAMEQLTCPVSGGHLGSMDKPVKQVVEGKTFFLCCSGCLDEVKANPKGVLAKLEKK